MYNRSILVGRLTADPDVRYTANGVPVARFRMAVDRPFKSQSGERETDFINVVAWRKLAEFAHSHLNKGKLILAEGRLQVREYTGNDGVRRWQTEVVADNIRFVGPKEPQTTAEAAASEHDAEPEPGPEPSDAGDDPITRDEFGDA